MQKTTDEKQIINQYDYILTNDLLSSKLCNISKPVKVAKIIKDFISWQCFKGAKLIYQQFK